MNQYGYIISNKKKMKGKIGLWDWKDLLLCGAVYAVNLLLIVPLFKDTDFQVQSYYMMTLVFAALIAEHPDFNIRIYEFMWKYIKFFTMPKNYYFKQKGERRWIQ